MANPFDQFDNAPAVPTKLVTRGGAPAFVPQGAQPAAPAAAPQGNPFDQFDAAPAAEPAAAPREPRSVEDLQAEYNAQPWYGKAGQAADDIMRQVANGVTFGFADKVVGALGGDTEGERIKTEEARRRSGSAGTVAEFGSSLALPMGAAKNGATLIGRFGSEGAKGLGGLLARAGLAGAEGAGYGALSAAGNDQDIGDGALMGAVFGAGGSTVLDGARKVGQAALRGSGRASMTPDQARQAATAAYDAAEQAGVAYTPRSVARVQNDVTSKLADFGYDPALHPGAAAVLSRIEGAAAGASQPGGGNITLKGWDTLRKVASNGYVQGNASNNKVVDMLVSAIDDAVENPRAGEVLMGDAKLGGAALNEARSLWSRVAKSGRVETALENADYQAAKAIGGGNVDRTIRDSMNQLRKNGSRGFLPAEEEALDRAIRGDTVQNTMGVLGRFAPRNAFTSMGGAGAVGYAINPIAAAAVPVAGYLADKGAARMSQNNVQELLNIIMNGGKALPQTGAQQAVQGMYDPAIRAIIAPGQGSYVPPEQR